MSETRDKQTKLPNGGRFQKGADPRRHKFSTEECQAGFQAALVSIITRYPNAIGADGRHMACNFLLRRRKPDTLDY